MQTFLPILLFHISFTSSYVDEHHYFPKEMTSKKLHNKMLAIVLKIRSTKWITWSRANKILCLIYWLEQIKDKDKWIIWNVSLPLPKEMQGLTLTISLHQIPHWHCRLEQNHPSTNYHGVNLGQQFREFENCLAPFLPKISISAICLLHFSPRWKFGEV